MAGMPCQDSEHLEVSEDGILSALKMKSSDVEPSDLAQWSLLVAPPMSRQHILLC